MLDGRLQVEGLIVGTLYIDTGGNAANSGSSDSNSPDLSGTTATRASANVVQLDSGTVLTGIVTSGPTQSSINIAGATNSNRTVFWITGVSGSGGATPQVTLDADPTGMTTNNWRIGGRMVYTAANFEAALRAGDEVVFNNTPASKAATFFTCRVGGSDAGGLITLRGKTGVRPLLETTNASVVVSAGGNSNYRFKNLEFKRSGGASTDVISSLGGGSIVEDCKISGAPTAGWGILTSAGVKIINTEITGCASGGIVSAVVNVPTLIQGCHIHDNVGNGIEFSNAGTMSTIIGTVVDSNGGRGIYLSGAPATQSFALIIDRVTVYGNGNSGLEIGDASLPVVVTNSIFMNNGNAAGEYNVEWGAGAAETFGFHGNNCFYQDGTTLATGAANLSSLTANASEITGDPLFVDPANGDFRLGTGSPAKAVGYPGVLLGGQTGYLDMGALQSQAVASTPHVIGG